MKKYFALIISVIVILTCFTACKPKLKGGEVVTNAAGEGFAAVTKEGGGIARDEAGNLIVLVTDAKGRNVKGENGEYQTNAIAIEHALVIGNRIECPDFAIEIPSGWSDSLSFNDIVIKKDGSEDTVRIHTDRNESLSSVIENSTKVIDAIKSGYGNTVLENKGIKVGENDAQFISAFVPDNGEGIASYLGYIFFKQGSVIFTCSVMSNRDMSSDIDSIVKILNTIEFK